MLNGADGSKYGEGAVSEDGQIMATYCHGLFDNPAALAALLEWAGHKPSATFDPAARRAPKTRAAYLGAQHISVRYEDGRSIDIDTWLAGQGVQRELVATVPAYAGIAALLRGSQRLATGPALLARGVLARLEGGGRSTGYELNESPA